MKLNIPVPQSFGNKKGQVIQSDRSGFIMRTKPAPRQWQNERQALKDNFYMNCLRQWAALSIEEKQNWHTWAATYPQPSISNPANSLNGFNLFVKRSVYLAMQQGNPEPFMTDPTLIEYNAESVAVTMYQGESSFKLKLDFTNADENLTCLIYLSFPTSPGKKFPGTRYRFITTVSNVDQTIDVTNEYVRQFGIIPAIGQHLFFSVVFVGHDQGQFWFRESGAGVVIPEPPPFLLPTYGDLYNYYAVSNANFAPTGWHVPTDAEWTTLTAALGYSLLAGGKLKETGFEHWLSPNTGATNESQLTFLGGGQRQNNGTFGSLKNSGFWWSKTAASSTNAWRRYITYNYAYIYRTSSDFHFGLSVRLVKNNSVNEGSVTDYNGNVYQTITVGSQVWTNVNWRCHNLSDGTPIQEVQSNSEFSTTTLPARCFYNNDNSNE